MFYDDEKNATPRKGRPADETASERRTRDTIPASPDSKRPPTAAVIVALAELELYTR